MNHPTDSDSTVSFAPQDRALQRMASPANDVLEFWFGTGPWSESVYRERSAAWFGGAATLDAEIGQRFSADVYHAGVGEYDTWVTTARGALAWTILLDQFPRHLFRGTAAAYRHDDRVRAVCLSVLEARLDTQLVPIERSFLYLPLQHSERIEDQRRSVRLFERLERELSADDWFRPYASHGVEMAHLHARLIQRYGRFPHRNVPLNRTSTFAEQMYLSAGGSDFGQGRR